MTTLKKIVVTFVAASLVLIAAPAPSRAHHLPSRYCSEDICQSTTKVDGRRKLGLLMAARYFSVFHLCVLDPDGYRICVPVRVRYRGDGLYGRDVSWRRRFPYGGKGAYTVTWVVDGERIGARLGFHVR